VADGVFGLRGFVVIFLEEPNAEWVFVWFETERVLFFL
jgi:hypothetical protein